MCNNKEIKMKSKVFGMYGKTLVLLGISAVLGGSIMAAPMEFNGAFKGTNIPDGWAQNKPNSWDSEGKISLTTVPDIEKTSVALVSKSKKMHLYTKKAFNVVKGDVVELKVMVRGKGNGLIGLYFYPAGGLMPKGIKFSEEWTEVTVKFTISTNKIKNIRIVFGVQAGSSAEFMDITGKIISKTAAAK
jgi:hypothetical protein